MACIPRSSHGGTVLQPRSRTSAAGGRQRRSAGRAHCGPPGERRGARRARRFPYYIGVVGKLTSLRIMTPETPVAGASAGSLIAACHHAGLTEKQVTEACWVLCDDCRRNGTRGRLGKVLERCARPLGALLVADLGGAAGGRSRCPSSQAARPWCARAHAGRGGRAAACLAAPRAGALPGR